MQKSSFLRGLGSRICIAAKVMRTASWSMKTKANIKVFGEENGWPARCAGKNLTWPCFSLMHLMRPGSPGAHAYPNASVMRETDEVFYSLGPFQFREGKLRI